MGKTVRAIRKATYDLTTEVTKELEREQKDPPPQPEVKAKDKNHAA